LLFFCYFADAAAICRRCFASFALLADFWPRFSLPMSRLLPFCFAQIVFHAVDTRPFAVACRCRLRQLCRRLRRFSPPLMPPVCRQPPPDAKPRHGLRSDLFYAAGAAPFTLLLFFEFCRCCFRCFRCRCAMPPDGYAAGKMPFFDAAATPLMPP